MAIHPTGHYQHAYSFIKCNDPNFKKWALLTENYLLAVGDSDSFGFISGGARYMGRKLAIDFGGFIPVTSEIERLFVLPWLGITVPFK